MGKPADFTVGQQLGYQNLNTAINWGRPVAAYKIGSQSVTSSTALVNDSLLFVPVAANTSYHLTTFLIFQASTAGDFAVAWSAPAGSTLYWTLGSLGQGSSTPDAGIYQGLSTLASTEYAGGTGAQVVARPEGVLVTGSTAGNLQLRWSQGTSDGTPTTVYGGSLVMLEPFA